jgi:hypothetical protein
VKLGREGSGKGGRIDEDAGQSLHPQRFYSQKPDSIWIANPVFMHFFFAHSSHPGSCHSKDQLHMLISEALTLARNTLSQIYPYGHFCKFLAILGNASRLRGPQIAPFGGGCFPYIAYPFAGSLVTWALLKPIIFRPKRSPNNLWMFQESCYWLLSEVRRFVCQILCLCLAQTCQWPQLFSPETHRSALMLVCTSSDSHLEFE